MKIIACEGVMLGTVSTFYDVDAVLIAVSADDDDGDALNEV